MKVQRISKNSIFLLLGLYIFSIFVLEITSVPNRILLALLICISLYDYYTLKKIKIHIDSLLLQFFFVLPLLFSSVLLCNGDFTLLNVSFPLFLLILNADIFKGKRILNHVYHLLNISILTVFLFCILGVTYRFYINYFASNSIVQAFSEISKTYWWNSFVHKSLVSPLQIHPSYLSLFTLIAINKALNNLSNEIKTNNIDKYNLISLLVLILFTLMIASKMAYLVLACLLSLFLFGLAKRKLYKTTLLILLVIVIILSSLYFLLPSIKDRITIDYRNFKQSGYNLDNKSPASERIFIWKTSSELIVENPYGLYCSNIKEIIWNRLNKSNKSELIEKNAHNNFLEFGLIYGYLGIIFLISILFYLVRTAINNKDFVFLGVILVFTLFSMVESTLVRELGVIYMAFMVQLHIINPRKQN